jgi:parallel beta-helix repeat protein
MRRTFAISIACAALLCVVPAALAVAPPAALRVTRVGSASVTLQWPNVTSAAGYEVLRNDKVVAIVSASTYVDNARKQLTLASYRVRSIDASGVRGTRSIAAYATTRSGNSCTRFANASIGSNANSGLTADAPVRTVSYLATLLDAGDVGCLTGTFAEDATIRTSGTAAQPVVLRSASRRSRARIAGRLWIPDASTHVVLQDLRLDGRNRTGDDLPSPTIEGDGAILIDNDITNHRTAICVILGSIRGYGKATGVIIDRNRIHDCGERPGNNHHHGIYLENAEHTRIVNNVIYANADRGIQLYPNALHTLIARNVLAANGEGVIFSGDHGYASSNNRVIDNVITHARTRYNIEYYWPVGNPVGTGNVASRNCLYGAHDGNLATPAIGVTYRGNDDAIPGYNSLKKADFRRTSKTRGLCRALLAPSVTPLAP